MVVEKEPKGDCGEVGETVEVGEKLDGFTKTNRENLAGYRGIN